ncbi:MAG TPA: hypothetical protein VGR76_14050, partial [Candidatus Angelobacter sp.]|nr:hypothetical protein [Candidatus Angelobacter sp.]
LGAPPGNPAVPTPWIALALVLVGIAAWMSAPGQSRRLRKTAVLVPVLATLLLALTFIGCGGGGGAAPPPPPPPGVTGTPAGSYTFMVTAKSASSTNPDQSANLLLNVR